MRTRDSAKRLLDLFLVVAGLVVLSPVLGAVAVLVRATLGRPILFRQKRSGLQGSPFTLLKFRTMTDARDEEGNPLPDGERLTRLGAFLRRTSLDELPTLLNVLKGDMSLVGPRPLITKYLDRYSPEQKRRLEVKPGITGWNQINGRNALTWDEKFTLDVWYVENRSLWLDVKILARTSVHVLTGRGVAAPGHATMPEFKGEQKESQG
jgi:sugar transferase EpsL